MGAGLRHLEERFPKLIHCRVSGFGADGPLGGLPGYDACAQAMCGLMSVNGEADGDATRVGLPVVDMVTGLNAAVAILLALNERAQRAGPVPRHHAVRLRAVAAASARAQLLLQRQDAGPQRQRASQHRALRDPAHRQRPIFLAVGNNRQFAQLAQVLEAPALAADPRYAANADRLAHRQALRDDLSALLAHHEAAALADRLLRAGVPAAAVQTVDQALAHPHTRHRGMVLEQGDYRGVGSPIKLSRTPATLRRLPPDLAPPQP